MWDILFVIEKNDWLPHALPVWINHVTEYLRKCN
jgi:hypothetical protein